MKYLLVIMAFLLLSCGQGNIKEKNHLEKEQQPENPKNIPQTESPQNLNEDGWEAAAEVDAQKPKEINIQNLITAMAEKDDEEFLRQFPKNFGQFHGYFGWDTPKDAPYELYEHGVHYIEYLFYLLRTNKYPTFEKTIIAICENGKWEADSVNYFQHHVLNLIKESGKYYLIDELSDDKAKSVLFFLFDGPHPEFDGDFASNLSASKKTILNDLFETVFFNGHENPGPFPGEGTNMTYTFSEYIENEHFFTRDIDINNDGLLDKIVSAHPYQGDELLLFINNAGEFQFSLKTTNFSEDGGHQIDDVVAEESGFFVKTVFPDRGLNEAYHHIALKDGRWVLTNTVYKTLSGNQEDAFIYVCDIEQGLDLADTNFFGKLKLMPEEAEKNRICTKEMR